MSRASIGSDVQYLREQAKGTIKEYVTEHLSEQYQVCLAALDTILKHAYEILYWYLTYQKHPKIESRTPDSERRKINTKQVQKTGRRLGQEVPTVVREQQVDT
jgi:hypothetical protein